MSSMDELSEILKSERLNQGLSLKAVSDRIGISMSMLELLEEGEYARIGTSLLIRNFVRAYCSVLGIDPEPLLEKHGAKIHASDVQDQGIQKYRTVVKALRKRRRIGLLPVLFLLIATAVGTYGATWLWKRYERQLLQQNMNTGGYVQQELPSDLPEKKGRAAERVSVGPGEPVPVPSTEVQRAATPTPSMERTNENLPEQRRTEESPGSKAVNVGSSPSEILPEEGPGETKEEAIQKQRFFVEADQKTWVQVKIDGKHTEEALLQPGDSREWEADESMQVVVGNAGGVRMMWNGESFGIPARPGSVLRFKLPDHIR